MREHMRLQVIASIELPGTKRAGGHLRWWVIARNSLIFKCLAMCHRQFMPS